MTNTRVERVDARNRYEIYVSDQADTEAAPAGETLAGFAEFSQEDGKVRFTHTVIDHAFRGRGLGDVLAADALADAAQRGDTIVPLCPFIAKYLTENEVAGAVVQWPHGAPQNAATPPEPSS
ncbi:GNAT family N-acetyltransferase [Microbacterium sp. Marseille-Q6965]|uniref:GNAT family N-acetyltransferase n=1 Tax=Microbacterium sp. Marseille-Q6965 TaxID=2965072 RepID=UPI0021B7FFBD|nr:GNAT family N-acetyltransferase [Microbacterium sp. Marseille-Q6965]